MSENQAGGRLAQVIATRGGLAPPEAPFVIEHREALYLHAVRGRRARARHHVPVPVRRVLAEAVRSRGPDPRRSRSGPALAQAHRHVATQEMLHLSLVQNLLSAIGGAPHLSRPNFPHPASHYPAGVHLALLPFGEAALQHFMFLERPEGMDIDDAEGMAAFGRASPGHAAGRDRPPQPGLQDRRAPVPVHRGRDRAPGRQVRRAAGCSSARRGPRPPSSTSAGPSWSR